MPSKIRPKLLSTALISALTAILAGPMAADEMSFPELQPADIDGAPKLQDLFLVMGSTKPVWTGKHGLAAPALWDWNGDGKRDLLVGEFETNSGENFPMGADGSTLRVYLNVGTDRDPKFTDEWEWARDTEGTIMEIPQWCCIGFTPMFYDLDDDGFQDMITGQYHPGEITWFRGSEEGFRPGIKVPQEGDPASNGNPMWGNYEGEPGDIGTFEYWVYSSATMADVDDDGDFDLIVGGSGGLRVSENIGGRKNPSFAFRELLLDVNGQPLMTREHTEQEKEYANAGIGLSPAGDGKSNPTAADWNNDGVIDLLVTDSYRDPSSRAISYFQGVRTADGLRFMPGIDLLPAKDGAKALPGSGNRVYVDDWNLDGVNDLIIGASVATVNDGEYSDELSWEWEDITKVESAGKDPGLYPPRERPTEASMREFYGDRGSEEEFQKHLKLNQDFWDKDIGRLYKEGKEHWLTMRHQGRVYVMLGKAPANPAQTQLTSSAANQAAKPAKEMTKRKSPVAPTIDPTQPVTAGETVDLTVNFDMLPQWYIFAPTGRASKEGFIETTVSFELPEGFETRGNLQMPPFGYKGQFHIFDGTGVKWTQAVATSADLSPGEYPISCKVRYQTCKNDVCLPPRTETLQAMVSIN